MCSPSLFATVFFFSIGVVERGRWHGLRDWERVGLCTVLCLVPFFALIFPFISFVVVEVRNPSGLVCLERLLFWVVLFPRIFLRRRLIFEDGGCKVMRSAFLNPEEAFKI